MKKTREVTVHKANLSLGEGESLNDYMQKMKTALAGFLLPQLKVAKNGSVWPIEVFSNSVIAEVYAPTTKDDESSYRLFKCDYTRKGEEFKFGGAVEVRRGYVEVEPDGEDNGDDDMMKTKAAVKKSTELWTGVL